MSIRPRFTRCFMSLLLVLAPAGSNLVSRPPDRVGIGEPGVARIPEFGEEALAPAAGGMIHCLDGVRAAVVRVYERVPNRLGLPRYAGAGETAIHRAIREAARLIGEGHYLPAMRLLRDLEDEIRQAHQSGDIVALMDKWNARFPSDLEVDVIDLDLGPLLEAVIRQWDTIPEDLDAAAFEARLRETAGNPVETEDLASSLREAAEGAGYDSIEDFLDDYADLLDIETRFDVEVTAPLQESFGGRTLVTLTIRGRPVIGTILFALRDQYPVLRERPWALRLEPDVESGYATVLLGTKLTLIIPSDDPSEPPSWIWGPANRAVWGLPILLSALFQGVSPGLHLAALAAAVGLTAVGVMTDPAFFGAKVLERQAALRRAA